MLHLHLQKTGNFGSLKDKYNVKKKGLLVSQLDEHEKHRSSHLRSIIKKLCKLQTPNTTQKMKFSIKDFFSKCDQIRRKLQIWSHLLKRYLFESFIFCALQVKGIWQLYL